MHSKAVVLSLLAASGALAAPHSRRYYDDKVTVALSDGGETGAQVTLESTVRDMGAPAISGPFNSIEIRLGEDVQNQELRCQALDNYGYPIVATRGTNIDTTFSDADKGPWTFRQASYVSEVVCDPTFVKIDPASDELNLRVILESQSTETGSQTSLPAGYRAESAPVATSGPFETVELSVGSLVEQQNYRCQILDLYGNPLVVLRGANRDITFSDADKGAWTLETPSEVSEIICDPTFA
ncbi:uncharacterized protein PV07_12274 [Cladophialophora immunda]|uniref:Ubiquitin 3 binding protein But2 C-terminal domain-containing protein n=1 Tax=Cladophialophora immunda TaxID=569365 RepID=A0A0D2CFP9_9EURO|nr:uncharacterized protein PV07_12274 [Cladophialophora immunda]KIW22384.1 hypothetical protein PV07_12274 [Cladophialophora immunda]OQU98160.1 hypothetical protein CLAIMM_03984 [Cladophialophora immunda]